MQVSQVQAHRLSDVPRERILRGKNHWWFLGAGGVARIYPRHLTAAGTLTADAERYLRDQGLFDARQSSTYLLTVLTSTDCNLGCGYCFQNTGQDPAGKNRPPRIAHARLSSAVITNILEFARRQMSAVGLDKLHVLLFGGEPLLNPKGCRELLARASDYGLVSAAMISNATLLTPLLARQLADLGLRDVQVTFDGHRDLHDEIRVRRSGGGTFDAIIENIVRVSAQTSIRWMLRVNVSHHNQDGIDDLLDQLAARLDVSRCGIHFAWVGDVGVGYANELRHTRELAEDFLRWRRRALEMGFKVSRPRAFMPCRTCSFSNGRYGAVINSDGTLASCWETAGKPGWDVGTVTAGYLPSEATRGRWISCEDNFQYTDDDSALAAFRDAADAGFLDYLDETGRL
jgi:uncharacterized protein